MIFVIYVFKHQFDELEINAFHYNQSTKPKAKILNLHVFATIYRPRD